MHDVIVIGGGPAGLQAALTFGRVHRSVLLLDSGHYRNGTVEHMHNFISRDGLPPSELRAIARTELDGYDTVEVREIAATSVEPDGGTFRVASADGEMSTSRAVVLATGVRDALPDTPGLDELWGREAANCPFCHGHELAGGVVGILGSGPHVGSMGAMLSPVASPIVVLADGGEVDAEVAERLARLASTSDPSRSPSCGVPTKAWWRVSTAAATSGWPASLWHRRRVSRPRSPISSAWRCCPRAASRSTQPDTPA